MMLKTPFLKLFRKFFLFNFLIILSVTITSCGEEKKIQAPTPTSTKIVIKEEFKNKVAEKSTDEYMLLETSCLYCHRMSNSSKENTLIAPFMHEVRDVYKKEYPSKSDFVKAIIAYKLNPSVDKSLMPDAIEQYGVMPDTGILEEDIEEITTYLFDYQF